MKGSTLETINKVCLAFLFISGRCFFYTFLIVAFAVEWCTRLWFEEEGISIGYKFVVTEMVLAVFSNMILNYYWSWLIILQVQRFIAGVPEKSFTGTDEDDQRAEEAEISKDR